MKIRTIFLTLLFLLPCEIWTAVTLHYKPLLDPIIPALYCIWAGIIFVVVTFIVAANLLITCCINLFRNTISNTSFLILLICFFFALGFVFSKVKILNPLLKKFLPKKSVQEFFIGFKKAIGNLLMLSAGIVVISRILWEVLICFIKLKEVKIT